MKQRGWFSMPEREGYRTLEEQMTGLGRALAEARGRTVLDLGCAEGLIALEFARAGAAEVTGVELLEKYLEVARRICAGSCIRLHQADLNDEQDLGSFDVVLALAVVHKLRSPARGLALAASACRDLLVLRWPIWIGHDGWLKSKNSTEGVNAPRALRALGFRDEGTEAGPRGECVHYWRRESGLGR